MAARDDDIDGSQGLVYPFWGMKTRERISQAKRTSALLRSWLFLHTWWGEQLIINRFAMQCPSTLGTYARKWLNVVQIRGGDKAEKWVFAVILELKCYN